MVGYAFGANWRDPYARGSGIAALDDHPIVQVSYTDALAYAAWAGTDLPIEAEWEFAARGGLDGTDFAWGNELEPGGAVLASYWRSEFPWRNMGLYRDTGTSPVKSFPPNGHELFDMIGNVWEWTRDAVLPATGSTSPCCSPARGDMPNQSSLPRALKGGSHLCASSYCRRYRPAARHIQPVDSPTTHIGFRCVRRQDAI